MAVKSLVLALMILASIEAVTQTGGVLTSEELKTNLIENEASAFQQELQQNYSDETSLIEESTNSTINTEDRTESNVLYVLIADEQNRTNSPLNNLDLQSEEMKEILKKGIQKMENSGNNTSQTKPMEISTESQNDSNLNKSSDKAGMKLNNAQKFPGSSFLDEVNATIRQEIGIQNSPETDSLEKNSTEINSLEKNSTETNSLEKNSNEINSLQKNSHDTISLMNNLQSLNEPKNNELASSSEEVATEENLQLVNVVRLDQENNLPRIRNKLEPSNLYKYLKQLQEKCNCNILQASAPIQHQLDALSSYENFSTEEKLQTLNEIKNPVNAREGRQLLTGGSMTTAAMILGGPLIAGAIYAGATAPQEFQQSVIQPFEDVGEMLMTQPGSQETGLRSMIQRTMGDLRDTATYVEDQFYGMFQDEEGTETDDGVKTEQQILNLQPNLRYGSNMMMQGMHSNVPGTIGMLQGLPHNIGIQQGLHHNVGIQQGLPHNVGIQQGLPHHTIDLHQGLLKGIGSQNHMLRDIGMQQGIPSYVDMHQRMPGSLGLQQEMKNNFDIQQMIQSHQQKQPLAERFAQISQMMNSGSNQQRQPMSEIYHMMNSQSNQQTRPSFMNNIPAMHNTQPTGLDHFRNNHLLEAPELSNNFLRRLDQGEGNRNVHQNKIMSRSLSSVEQLDTKTFPANLSPYNNPHLLKSMVETAKHNNNIATSRQFNGEPSASVNHEVIVAQDKHFNSINQPMYRNFLGIHNGPLTKEQIREKIKSNKSEKENIRTQFQNNPTTIRPSPSNIILERRIDTSMSSNGFQNIRPDTIISLSQVPQNKSVEVNILPHPSPLVSEKLDFTEQSRGSQPILMLPRPAALTSQKNSIFREQNNIANQFNELNNNVNQFQDRKDQFFYERPSASRVNGGIENGLAHQSTKENTQGKDYKSSFKVFGTGNSKVAVSNHENVHVHIHDRKNNNDHFVPTSDTSNFIKSNNEEVTFKSQEKLEKHFIHAPDAQPMETIEAPHYSPARSIYSDGNSRKSNVKQNPSNIQDVIHNGDNISNERPLKPLIMDIFKEINNDNSNDIIRKEIPPPKKRLIKKNRRKVLADAGRFTSPEKLRRFRGVQPDSSEIIKIKRFSNNIRRQDSTRDKISSKYKNKNKKKYAIVMKKSDHNARGFVTSRKPLDKFFRIKSGENSNKNKDSNFDESTSMRKKYSKIKYVDHLSGSTQNAVQKSDSPNKKHKYIIVNSRSSENKRNSYSDSHARNIMKKLNEESLEDVGKYFESEAISSKEDPIADIKYFSAKKKSRVSIQDLKPEVLSDWKFDTAQNKLEGVNRQEHMASSPTTIKSFKSNVDALREFKKMQELEIEKSTKRNSVERLKEIRDEVMKNFHVPKGSSSPKNRGMDIKTFAKGSSEWIGKMKQDKFEKKNKQLLMKRILEIEPSNYEINTLGIQTPQSSFVSFVDPTGRINNPVNSHNIQTPKPLYAISDLRRVSEKNLNRRSDQDKSSFMSFVAKTGFNIAGGQYQPHDNRRNNDKSSISENEDIVTGKMPKFSSPTLKEEQLDGRRRILKKRIKKYLKRKINREKEHNYRVSHTNAHESGPTDRQFRARAFNFYSGDEILHGDIEPLSAGSTEFGVSMKFGQNFVNNYPR